MKSKCILMQSRQKKMRKTLHKLQRQRGRRRRGLRTKSTAAAILLVGLMMARSASTLVAMTMKTLLQHFGELSLILTFSLDPETQFDKSYSRVTILARLWSSPDFSKFYREKYHAIILDHFVVGLLNSRLSA